MITYLRPLNLYPIFIAIGLILALFVGFSLFKGSTKTARACFFIGNGAYYALSAQDSYDNPPAFDSIKNSKEFVEKFIPDSVLNDFLRALFEKEENIFVTYKTWNSFLHLTQRIKNIFAEFGITKPLEQIFIDENTYLPKNLESSLQKKFIISKCNPSECRNVTNEPPYHPFLFYGPTESQLKNLPIEQRLDAFKKECGILHPFFANLFHLLHIYNPADWRMYDTNTGFFYFTPRYSYSSANITNFKQLNSLNAYENEPQTDCKVHEDDWAFHLDKLFTSTNTSWQVYLTGHGSDPIYSGNEMFEEKTVNNVPWKAWIGGVPSMKFKPFLEFLDSKINTEKLFISSCHVPAKRLLNLATKPLSYKIISPIASYDTVTCYVPFGYMTSYVPSWLTADQKTKIEYTLKPSDSEIATPLDIPKYSSLLSNTEHKELRKYINTFVENKYYDAPSIIEANSNKVEKLMA